MRLAVLVALFCGSVAHAETSPYDRVSFDRVKLGELDELVLLGLSTDGSRWAYVDGRSKDTAGFVSIDAAMLETATGKVLAHFVLDPRYVAKSAAMNVARPRYDEFLGKVRAAGVAPENGKPWTRDGDRFVNGKLAIEMKPERARELGDAKALTAYAVHLVETDDDASLVQLYDAAENSAAPKLLEVIGSNDAIVVHLASEHFAAFDPRTQKVFGTTLTKIHAGRPVRASIADGIAAHRAGDDRAAQHAFRHAVELDPRCARARYDLAAIGAKLGDNHEALRMLGALADANMPLLKLKMVNDPDFAQARRRQVYGKYIGPDPSEPFSEPNANGLATRLTVSGPQSLEREVSLELTVVNLSDKRARFCRYQTPFEVMLSHDLEVADKDGRLRPYRGIMAKRVAPGPADYVFVEPQADVHVTFDLTKAYELWPGVYNVRFLGGAVSDLPDSPVVAVTVTP